MVSVHSNKALVKRYRSKELESPMSKELESPIFITNTQTYEQLKGLPPTTTNMSQATHIHILVNRRTHPYVHMEKYDLRKHFIHVSQLYDYIMNHHEYHVEVLEMELIAATERENPQSKINNLYSYAPPSTISLKHTLSWVYPFTGLDYWTDTLLGAHNILGSLPKDVPGIFSSLLNNKKPYFANCTIAHLNIVHNYSKYNIVQLNRNRKQASKDVLS